MANWDDSLDRIVADALHGRVTRRDFLVRAVALGLSLPAAGALLAACQAAATPSPTGAPTAAPTSAPTGAPTAAPTAEPTPAPTGPQAGGVLLFARQSEPVTLSPCGPSGASENGSIWVITNIFDQLVEVQPGKSSPQPGLAESWDWAPDNLSVTFKLRDAKFSNGDPVTADDVKFTLDRFIDTNINVYYGGVAASTKACTVVDPKTVKIELKQVDGAFLDNYATFVPSIIPRKYFESLGATEEERDKAFAEKPIGSGPFMVKSWVRGQTLELVKNPNYWKPGQPYLDGVTFLYIADDNTRILKLKSGEVQVAAEIPYAQVDSLGKSEGTTVLVEQIASWKHIWLNNSQKPYDDKKVRQALNWATPKEAILKSVLFGSAAIANNIIARVKYNDDALAPYGYDIDKARALLAESSVPTGFRTSLLIVAGDSVEKQIAEIVQQEWAKIGVELTIEAVDVATIWQRYQSGTEAIAVTFPGSFLSSDTLSDDNLAFVFLDPGTGANSFWTYYNNPQVIALLKEASGTTDEAVRTQKFREIQKIALDDAPAVTEFFTTARTGLRGEVQGFATCLTGWWNLEDVSLGS